MTERLLGEAGGYEVSLLWIPGREDDASICLTGPGLMTSHIPLSGWLAFADAVQQAQTEIVALGDGVFEEGDA